jgi:hypothetical protein
MLHCLAHTVMRGLAEGMILVSLDRLLQDRRRNFG